MVAKKTAAKKTTATKKADATRTDATKADGTKADGKVPAAKKVAAARVPAKKAPAKKTAAPAKKAVKATKPAKTATSAPTADTAKSKSIKNAKNAKNVTEKKTGARTVAAKKTAGGVTTAETDTAVPQARSGELAVRPGEDPWTAAEVAEARSELQSEVLRLRSELAHSQEELTGLMRDSGDGAGDDQADTGTKNITREHELALAANAREMLEQTEHALERLDAGTYGLCEVCGKPIGKARMQAFPRATLCVEDKQKQERRG
ncbi:TraR/DksA family transcriptional regulator [Streptomyces sp. NPDC053493]|uniref:TraR/DksA family transcriptional regulator n=1 Tax=Streptomyces sp. NPDC053493 TaxID=3365705 RepID=UPI0037CFF2DC